MSAYERALAALASLEILGEERRETIAVAILALIEAHTGGGPLEREDFAALDEALRAEDRVASDEEVEALFKTLLR